ncbi:hypothetical protein WPS_35320 [Vulcanimicrobium alpinum]|uniref:DUF190 domain-containing protein n=1 Tax=Vulcanimicrobium alpinum TaxID=3016050 RepID=A0AAN1Y0A9_UNVUL|nr:DUF190 domain-containing protein [Vulcanimicrobium alpinum]BDE08256.1 hypothetical protein WPS_35320 [Vulcanimicrobium alpinum]
MNDETAKAYPYRPALRVSIYIGERDHHAGQPLYTAIVELARKLGIAGATVLRGIEGYGADAVVHSASIVDLSSNLPLIVVVIDELPRIQTFISTVADMLVDGMMTTEELEIVDHKHGKIL